MKKDPDVELKEQIARIRESYQSKKVQAEKRCYASKSGLHLLAIQDGRAKSMPDIVEQEKKDVERKMREELNELKIQEFNEIREILNSQPSKAIEPEETYEDEPVKTSITKKNTDKLAYWVSYTNRQIILNNKYLLAEPNFNSENDHFSDYIFNNPGKILKKEVESSKKITLKKKFHTIILQLGFKKEIRQLFFPGVRKVALTFRQSITNEEFKNLSINKKSLRESIDKLRLIKE